MMNSKRYAELVNYLVNCDQELGDIKREITNYEIQQMKLNQITNHILQCYEELAEMISSIANQQIMTAKVQNEEVVQRLIHIEGKEDSLLEGRQDELLQEIVTRLIHVEEKEDSLLEEKQGELLQEIVTRLIHIEEKEDVLVSEKQERAIVKLVERQLISGNFNESFIEALPDSICRGRYNAYYELLPLYTQRNSDNNVRDYSRYIAFIINIERILQNNIQGSFAEVGVYLGNNAAIMLPYCTKHQRKLFLFDTYEGFDSRDIVGIDENQIIQFQDTSLESVKEYVGENEYTRYVKGYFPESTTEEACSEKFAFVSLDCDLYNPIKSGLEFFWPRMSGGGMIFVHDYSSGFFEGCTKAVDEFCQEHQVNVVLMPDKSGTAVIIK